MVPIRIDAWFRVFSRLKTGPRVLAFGGDKPLVKFAALTLALAVLFSASTVWAQTGGSANPITISSSSATGIGLASAATYKVIQDSQWKDYEDVVIVAALNEIAKLSVDAGHPMTAMDYNNAIAQMRSSLDPKAPTNVVFPTEAACLGYAIDSLSPLTSSAQASPILRTAIWSLERLKFNQLKTALDPNRQTPADLALSGLAPNGYAFIAEHVKEANDLAHNDPQYSASVNGVLQELTGFDTTSSYSAIQALYPNAIPTLPNANNDGSITLNLQDLVTKDQATVTGVQSVIDADLADIEAQPVLAARLVPGASGVPSRLPLASASTGTCVAGTPAASGSVVISANDCTANKNTNTPDYWGSAQGAIDGLSTLAGYFDPKLATEITTVGNAEIQAGKAITQIDSLVSQGISFSTLLGFVSPTKALIGAGVEIFHSFFGSGSSSSPDTNVLGQIQILSQQIARLQQDMDSRFNRVDAELNTILKTLNNNFALIDYRLGVLNGDVNAIQAGLLDIQAQINRLEQYTLAYNQASSKEALISAMNGCLNYRAVHNGADIGSSMYGNCENQFYTWAHDSSVDELWAGVQQPDYTDGNIYNTFVNFPLSVDVNYLAQFPAANLGLPALSSGRVPNPNEWTLGARAYLELAHEWPQYATGISSTRLDDLVQAGTTLRKAIESTNSTVSSGVVSPNSALFSAVTNKCATAVTTTQTAVNQIQIQFGNNPVNSLQGVNLWGGSQQTSSYIPSISQIGGNGSSPGCVYPYGPRSVYADVPAGLLQKIPDAFRLAQSLGVGQVGLYLTANWVQFNPATCSPGGMSANLGVTIHATFNGVEFESWTVTGQELWTCPQTGDNPINYVLCNWDTSAPCCTQPLRAKFEDPSQVTQNFTPSFQAILTSAQQSVDTRLRSLEQSLYAQIAGSFAIAGPVQTAGQQLTASKLLVQAYANFGLPLSLESSDGLHSLLYGNQSIIDAGAIQADFLGFSTSAIPDTTDNKITDEFLTVNTRLSALSNAITGVLNQVQQSQLPESLPLVDVTLEDLQSFESLKNASALSACSYVLSPSSALVGSAGAIGTISVQEFNGCSWTARTNSTWLTTLLTPSGTGNGTVTYFVPANTTAAPRDAIFIIGDQIFKVTQVGTGSATGGGGGGGGGGGSTPDFSLPSSLGSQTLTAGTSTSYSVSVSSLNGFNGAVGFTVTGLPTGASGTFNPPSVSGGSGSTILNISTAGTTFEGDYTFAITGTAGSINHYGEAHLVVQGDISGSIPSSSATISVGSSATFGLTLSSIGGLTDQFTFSCPTPPQGLTCSFNPPTATLPPNGTVATQLTVTVISKPSGSAVTNRRLDWPNGWRLLAMQAAVLFVLCLLLFYRTRFLITQRLAVRMLVSLVFALVIGQISCGGGGGTTSGPQPPTPSAAHVTLSIQASSASVVKTVGTVQITVP